MYKGILRLKKMGSTREQKKNFQKLPLFFFLQIWEHSKYNKEQEKNSK